MPQIMTANRLIDGEVVYLSGDGAWVLDLSHACVADSDAAAASLQSRADQAERDQVIVGAYLAQVAVDDRGRPRPVSMREVIRATGPSIPIGAK